MNTKREPAACYSSFLSGYANKGISIFSTEGYQLGHYLG